MDKVEKEMRGKTGNLVWNIVGPLKWVAAVCVIAMMLLTVSDVILRFLRHPIPGTYEMVGFLGALFVSFSLAYTSIMGLHIAVDFVVRKLPPAARKIIEGVGEATGLVLFILLTWQCDKKCRGSFSYPTGTCLPICFWSGCWLRGVKYSTYFQG